MAGSIGGTVPGSGGLPNGHMPPIPGRKHTQLQTEKWLEVSFKSFLCFILRKNGAVPQCA